MVLKACILRTHDATQHHQLNACLKQVRYLVSDGLAGRTPVHVEGVSQDKPALTLR